MQVINTPGRFDRSPQLLADDVHHWTRKPDVSAVFFTEVANKDRAAQLAAPGWTTTHDGGPGKGECAIMTKDKRRQVVEQRWLKLTAGGGKGRLKAPVYAPVVITKAPSGRLTLFTVCHLPAHLERRWALLPLSKRAKVKALLKRPKLSPTIRVWLEAATNWHEKTMRLAAEHHVDDIVVAADWNLNSKQAWVRDLMARLWPGLALVATKDPDMGSRNIGWLMTNMRLEGSHVWHAEASDHNAGHFILRHVNAPHPDPKPAPKPPPPFQKVTYNGALMDQKTKTFVQCLEKDLGYPLTILQGCYHPGVSQSAGTHDGGGVLDLAPYDWGRKVTAARKRGGFYWHRLPIPGVWGEHIHGGIRNHGTLSDSAKAQQRDFDAHPPRNGLASHAVDTSGIHPNPPARFSYLAAWHEINDQEKK